MTVCCTVFLPRDYITNSLSREQTVQSNLSNKFPEVHTLYMRACDGSPCTNQKKASLHRKLQIVRLSCCCMFRYSMYDGWTKFEIQKTYCHFIRSGFIIHFPQTQLCFILIVSLQQGSVFRNQLEHQRCLFPAHSHYITVTLCITVELLQCCLLIADSAGCCWSRGLVWNTIICPPAAFIYSTFEICWVSFSEWGIGKHPLHIQQRRKSFFFMSQWCEMNAVRWDFCLFLSLTLGKL